MYLELSRNHAFIDSFIINILNTHFMSFLKLFIMITMTLSKLSTNYGYMFDP